MKRRGVSAVVANVLIILLVVVGVALIWAAVRPSIEKGSKGIGADCFSIDVKPVSCVVDLRDSTPTNWKVTVSLKRGSGKGDLKSVRLISLNDAYSIDSSIGFISSPLSRTQTINPVDVTNLKELESLSYDIHGIYSAAQPPFDIVGIARKLSIGIGVGPEDRLCSLISKEIDCTCIDSSVSPALSWCSSFVQFIE